jgi:hypothetical protein
VEIDAAQARDLVHGIESEATADASAVASVDGKSTVGLDNLTELLRPVSTDTVTVQARPDPVTCDELRSRPAAARPQPLLHG